MNNDIEKKLFQEHEGINLKKEISYYLFFWPWFLLTIIISLLIAYLYLRYTPNIYSSSAQVQITKSDASSSFLTNEVTSLFGSRINVENDIAVITSNLILKKVAQSLTLQTSITEIGRIKSSLVYDNDVPFKIQLKNLDSLQQWNLIITEGKAIISNEISSFVVNKNDSLVNDYFSLIISDLSSVNEKEFIIRNNSLKNVIISLKKRITATPTADRGEIINLGIFGTNKKRNDAILNALIDILIEDRIADQRQLSEASIRFIDQRLKSLQNNIDSISKLTISYQLNNDIYDSTR